MSPQGLFTDPETNSPGWGQGSDSAAPASTGRSRSHGDRTDVHAGSGGSAASSRRTQRDGTRGREGHSGFWQRRGRDVRKFHQSLCAAVSSQGWAQSAWGFRWGFPS